MKRVVIVIFSTFFLLSVFAEVRISGRVLENVNKGIPYVTVRLLDATDTLLVKGTMTNELGEYTIDNVKSGNYLLLFSCIGYSTKFLQLEVIDTNMHIPDVTLQSGNILMDEVIVKGTSFIRKKDHVVIIPDNQSIKHAFSAYDLLNNLMIPTINVNRDTGMVNTWGGTVTLYINGRKADYREIRSLRPKSIEKIEYFDAPSGIYSGDVASINLITKEQLEGGYVGLDALQRVGYLNGDYNVVTKYTLGNTNYTLFAGHNMTEYEGESANRKEAIYFPEFTINRSIITDNDLVKNNQQYAELSFLNKKRKRTLQTKVGLVRKDKPESNRSSSVKYTGFYNDSVTSKLYLEQSSLKPFIKLYGKFQLKKNQDLIMSLSSEYTKTDYTREYSENKYLSYSHIDEKNYSLETSIKYNIKLKHQNNFDVELFHLYTVDKTEYSGDYDNSQSLWVGESLLFFTYDQRFKKNISLNIRTGLSSQQYHLKGKEDVSNISPRFNLRFTYLAKEKHYFMANIAIGNNFPTIDLLTNAEQNIDAIQLKRGNPNLKAMKIYMPNVVYNTQWKNLNMTIGLMGMMLDNNIYYDYLLENTKLVHTYKSDSKFYSLQGMLSTTWKINKNLHLKIDGSWNRYILSGGYTNKYNSFNASVQMNYYVGDVSLKLKAFTPQRSLTSVGFYMKNPGGYNISIARNIRNWQWEIGGNNIFNNGFERKTCLQSDIYNYIDVQRGINDRMNGYIKVSYMFDFGKKVSRDKKNIDMNINSSILKIE